MANYRTCIFCAKNDSPPAREDVIPKWIAREFPNTSWDIKRYTLDVVGNKEARKQYKSIGGLGMISRRPCRRCNNTWMSQLEDQAKPVLLPLLYGEGRILSPSDRLTMVRWFIKTIILYEFLTSDIKYPKYWRAEERHALMSSLEVPGETMFFSGYYKGSKDITTREMRLPLAVRRRDNQRTVTVEGYSATFAIKHLALEVFSVRWPEDPEVMAIEWKLPGNWNDAIVPIWPIEGNVHWPPLYYLNDDGLDRLTHRWTTILRQP